MSSENSKKRKIEGEQSNFQMSTGDPNPLLYAQQQFMSSLPNTIQDNFFCIDKVDPETRAEIWAKQAEIGEDLVNDYSWATPDSRAMRILSHYQPSKSEEKQLFKTIYSFHLRA